MTRFTKISACCVALLSLNAVAAPPAEIVIQGERILPESITSSKNGAVFFGSIGTQAIYKAAPGAAVAELWIKPQSNGLENVFGVFADDKSNTLWACSGSAVFGPPQPGAKPPSSSLFAFNLKTGEFKNSYPFPTQGSSCNDIAVDADGNAYATDTGNAEVVQLKKGAKALVVWAGNGSLGAKNAVLDGIAVLGKKVFVNTLATSKIMSIAIERGAKAGAITEIKFDREIVRPDGMRSFGKKALLVVETGPSRLSKVVFDGDQGKVTTIKEGYTDGPTAVTVVGTTAYVSEIQFRRDPNAPAKPSKATAVEVGKP
jgi:sugar lactone lactonase YvrE